MKYLYRCVCVCVSFFSHVLHCSTHLLLLYWKSNFFFDFFRSQSTSCTISKGQSQRFHTTHTGNTFVAINFCAIFLLLLLCLIFQIIQRQPLSICICTLFKWQYIIEIACIHRGIYIHTFISNLLCARSTVNWYRHTSTHTQRHLYTCCSSNRSG